LEQTSVDSVILTATESIGWDSFKTILRHRTDSTVTASASGRDVFVALPPGKAFATMKKRVF